MVAKRIEYFDSLKFILIVLVVFGHVMEHDLYPSALRLSIYSFIYCFHMPLFVMISGYFSRNTSNSAKLLKHILRFFLSYLLFQAILYIPDFIGAKNVSLLDILFVPFRTMWYLAGLILWRVLIFVLDRLKVPAYLVILSSFLLSFVLFYISEPTRLLTFFPFFVIGYYLKDKQIERLTERKVWISILILVLVFVLIYMFGNDGFRNSLYFAYAPGPESLNCFYQMLMYPLTLFMSILVFNVCANLPSKIERFFAQYGSKTYAIYLLHSVLVYDIYFYLIEPSKTTPDVFDRYLLRDILVTALIIVICLFLDRFRAVKYIVDPYSLIENIKNKTKNKM